MTTNTIKILYVEDDIEDLELVKELLEQNQESKFDILHADKLSKGLKLLDSNKIDVVLLDLSLPDCIGLDTFKMFRSKAPMIPIIVLTGTLLHRSEIRQCIDGSHEYLVKGYVDGHSLAKSISNAIERQRLRKKLSEHFLDNGTNNKN